MQDADGVSVPVVLFGVPLPRIEMPIPDGMTRCCEFVHVTVHAGSWIVSPFTAVCVLGLHVPLPELTHAFTSLKAQEAGEYVPCAKATGAKRNIAKRAKRLVIIKMAQRLCKERYKYPFQRSRLHK